MQTIPVLWTSRKIFRSLAFGKLFSVLFIAFNHPCCGALEKSLQAPWSEKRGRTLFFGPSQEEGSRGFVFFCCLIASTWVAEGWMFIMLPRQVVRSYGDGGGGWAGWSVQHHHRDSVSTTSVSRPPGSVRNHTLGCPGGSMGDRFPADSPPLQLSLSAGQMLLLFSNLRILN